MWSGGIPHHITQRRNNRQEVFRVRRRPAILRPTDTPPTCAPRPASRDYVGRAATPAYRRRAVAGSSAARVSRPRSVPAANAGCVASTAVLLVLYIEIDGTGVPVVAAETIGWPGDNDSERARRREVKLGCLFTQSQCDEMKATGPCVRSFDELCRSARGSRGVRAAHLAAGLGAQLEPAKKKLVIGDGAVWIWNRSHQYFAGAIEVGELYDALQHLWELAAQLWPDDERGRRR